MVLVITGAWPRKGSNGQREKSVKLAIATYTPINLRHARMLLKVELSTTSNTAAAIAFRPTDAFFQQPS